MLKCDCGTCCHPDVSSAPNPTAPNPTAPNPRLAPPRPLVTTMAPVSTRVPRQVPATAAEVSAHQQAARGTNVPVRGSGSPKQRRSPLASSTSMMDPTRRKIPILAQPRYLSIGSAQPSGASFRFVCGVIGFKWRVQWLMQSRRIWLRALRCHVSHLRGCTLRRLLYISCHSIYAQVERSARRPWACYQPPDGYNEESEEVNAGRLPDQGRE